VLAENKKRALEDKNISIALSIFGKPLNYSM